MKVLKFVSSNKNKVLEIQHLLAKATSVNVEAVDIDLPEYQGTPEDVARLKTLEAIKVLHSGPVIIEDTSLCFSAWGGLPGVYIKWFLQNLGPDGISKLLEPYDDKNAVAQTIIGFCEGPGQEVVLFTGRTDGKIVGPRGSREFGWDPCFLPDECDKTYGEMTKDEKNKVSHRARALNQLTNNIISQQ